MPRIDHSTARRYAELPKKPTHTIAGLPFYLPRCYLHVSSIIFLHFTTGNDTPGPCGQDF